MTFPRRAAAAAALVLILAVAACGEDRDEGSGTGAGTGATGTATGETGGAAPSGPAVARVEVREVEYRLDPAKPRVGEAGIVEFAVANRGKVDHALEIETPSGEVETAAIRPGASATLRADLQPGTYTWYCPIADHEDRGMRGEVTVGREAGGDGTDTGESTDKTDTREDDSGGGRSGGGDSGRDGGGDDSGGGGRREKRPEPGQNDFSPAPGY